jgi:glycosyltransferase involved in cell wall biosynthesis
MANYNGAAHIAEAVRSVLAQDSVSLELIVSDDGSSDDSLARAEAAASGDARLIVLRCPDRTGPAGARNRALRAARGAWIAIVDNDDALEQGRLARLVAAAERDGADIAADNLLTFYEDGAQAPHPHLHGAFAREPCWIDAAAYVRSNLLLSGGAQLGYLKPIFRRRDELHYDESLRIGEDADLVLRLLLAGARMRTYPEIGYRYRKHAGSISHRLTGEVIAAMLAAHERLKQRTLNSPHFDGERIANLRSKVALETFESKASLDLKYDNEPDPSRASHLRSDALDAGSNRELRRALSRQRDALLDARAFVGLIGALKARNVRAAFAAALSRPGAVLLLRDPIGARLRRLFAVEHKLARPQRLGDSANMERAANQIAADTDGRPHA